MRNLKIMNSKERKKIQKLLEEQYDFKEKLDYVFLFNEKEKKIFIINKDISKIELKSINVNSLGLYFGQIYKEKLRLSIDSSQIIGPKAGKNILELDEKQRNAWLKGESLDINNMKNEDGFYLIKSGHDFIGTGRLFENKLSNFVPKARRIMDVS